MDGEQVVGGAAVLLGPETRSAERPSYRPVQSVQRILRVLRALNRRQVSSIDQLHTDTRLPKPTLVRMLETLIAEGYATKDKRQGGYMVTSMVESLGCGFHSDPLVVQAGRPWAQALTRRVLWPISIAALNGNEMVVRFSTVIDSPLSPEFATINMRLNLIDRAMGMAYLAFCSDGERETRLRMIEEERPGELALAGGRRRLELLLDVIRTDGFALRAPRSPPLATGTLALPIIVEGRVLGTIGMGYYRSALTNKTLVEEYVPLLRQVVRNIEIQIVGLSEGLSAATPG